MDPSTQIARHQARLAEIHYALDRISDSVLDLPGRLNAVTQVIRLQLGCDVCSIYLMDADAPTLTLRASYGLASSTIGRARLRVGEGVTGWVAEHMEAVALADAVTDERFKYLPDTGEEQFRSLLSVPIVTGQSFIGVINVQHRSVHPFSNHETLLVSGIGYKVGAMVRAARLERDLQQQQLGIDTLLAGIAMIGGGTAPILPTLLAKSRRATGAAGAILRRYDGNSNRLLVTHLDGARAQSAGFTPLAPGIGIAGMAAETGRTVRLNNYDDFAGDLVAMGAVSSSVLSVPLMMEHTLVGTLTVFDKDDPTGGFTLQDEQLLGGVARILSMAMG